ncbi:uncharacterized protein LOC133193682 [Saccostrea echinata]|uniref:uncharacterized protein LOC133193682 n=1 Tax=Saccostrea echinata TaxID=191078 RepID=UPI002A83BCCB|nr:uncharacterized protein LOC133193682 [Saccostrea echinata]
MIGKEATTGYGNLRQHLDNNVDMDGATETTKPGQTNKRGTFTAKQNFNRQGLQGDNRTSRDTRRLLTMSSPYKKRCNGDILKIGKGYIKKVYSQTVELEKAQSRLEIFLEMMDNRLRVIEVKMDFYKTMKANRLQDYLEDREQ